MNENSYKKNFLFIHNIRTSNLSLDELEQISMTDLSLNEWKIIAESRGIKGYKGMSKKRLLWALNKPKLDQERLKKY